MFVFHIYIHIKIPNKFRNASFILFLPVGKITARSDESVEEPFIFLLFFSNILYDFEDI